MNDDFRAIIAKYRARMGELKDVLDIDGRLHAVSKRERDRRIRKRDENRLTSDFQPPLWGLPIPFRPLLRTCKG